MQADSRYFFRLLSKLLLAALVLSASTRAQSATKVEIVPALGHSDTINAVAFSHDGTRVLSGSADTTSKIWDVKTGAMLRNLEGHSAAITSVAFSRDSTKVLTSSEDGTANLWDAGTGELLQTFRPSGGAVTAAAISPDGTRVLTGSWDLKLYLWDAATGARAQTFAPHTDNITLVAFSRDGTQVLSGCRDATFRLWDADTRKLLKTLKGHPDDVTSVAFSADNSRIVSGHWDNSIRIWDAATGELLGTPLTAHSGGVTSVALSGDGDRISSGAADGSIKLWNAQTGKLSPTTFKGHTKGIKSVAFSPDGNHLLSGGSDRTLRLWNAKTGKLLRTFEGQARSVNSISFSPEGTSVLSGSDDGTLKLWKADTGTLLRTFPGHKGGVTSVAFSRDGRHVLSGSRDKTVMLWETSSGTLLHTFKGHEDVVSSVALSPDGARVLSGSWDATVKLWDAVTGSPLKKFTKHAARVTSVAFSPDGARILSGSVDKTAKLLDPETDQLLKTFEVGSFVRSVAFSPNGGRVLTGSSDRKAKLWDVSTGDLLWIFESGTGWVNSAAFSPNKPTILVGNEDKTLKLLKSETGQLSRTFRGHLGEITSVAFSTFGSRVASGSRDGTLRIWNSATGTELASLIGGSKGPDQWLAMTPKGYFAGSGTDMLRVVRGPEQFSVLQFFDHLYRPDLVEEALKGDPQGEYKDAVHHRNLEGILDSGPAPEIELRERKTEQAGGTVRLTVRIKSTGGGIGEKIVWRVNGKAQGNRTPSALKGLGDDLLATRAVTETLIVDPSETNSVEVTAYNGAGLLATLPLQITVDRFGVTTAERPRMHVLAIGVDKYRKKKLELKYAAKDAREFADALKKVGSSLFADVKVTILTDEQVTREGIAAAFEQVAAEAKPNDVFVLFLGGHGKSVAGRYYYYPQNLEFAAGQTYQNGIGQDLWETWLDRVGHVKKTLLIFDTCESGSAGVLVRGVNAARRTAMEQLEHATGNNLIAAAGSSQSAVEGYQKHGVLTFALLEALSKKEGETGEEKVKVGTLAGYVAERVPAISKEVWQVEQTPVRKLSGYDFPIGFKTAGLLPADYIPSEPTHVLIRAELIRTRPAPDAPGDRQLMPGTQVRVVTFHADWAIVAREGEKMGYVPVESLAKLQ